VRRTLSVSTADCTSGTDRSPFSRLRVALPVVRLELNLKCIKGTFESGSDVVLPTQSAEDHHEERERQQAQVE
jgi:hypothetical protein